MNGDGFEADSSAGSCALLLDSSDTFGTTAGTGTSAIGAWVASGVTIGIGDSGLACIDWVDDGTLQPQSGTKTTSASVEAQAETAHPQPAAQPEFAIGDTEFEQPQSLVNAVAPQQSLLGIEQTGVRQQAWAVNARCKIRPANAGLNERRTERLDTIDNRIQYGKGLDI
ncbi:MAG: hypothetical protein SGI77_01190 [Pirellulaceae bacterium]|nr:hypothetical protein [Pirellulaceae bacterium]